jgi:hypothetical protein
MYAESRSFDAPSDLTVRSQHIHCTRDRESEGPPLEAHALASHLCSRNRLPAKVRAFIDFCLKAIAERG